MPFEIIVTNPVGAARELAGKGKITMAVYRGEPSNGHAKLEAHLTGGDILIVTDNWFSVNDRWRHRLALHPDYLPPAVTEVRDTFFPKPNPAKPEGFHYPITPGLFVGLKQPVVTVQYRGMARRRVVAFPGTVERLIVVS